LVAVIIIAWRTGLFMLIKAGVTFLIPPSTKSAARLVAKGRPETEVVAALRTDPAFNAAYKAEKKAQVNKENHS
jgi:predicted dinucleotide-binding enzyme